MDKQPVMNGTVAWLEFELQEVELVTGQYGMSWCQGVRSSVPGSFTRSWSKKMLTLVARIIRPAIREAAIPPIRFSAVFLSGRTQPLVEAIVQLAIEHSDFLI